MHIAGAVSWLACGSRACRRRVGGESNELVAFAFSAHERDTEPSRFLRSREVCVTDVCLMRCRAGMASRGAAKSRQSFLVRPKQGWLHDPNALAAGAGIFYSFPIRVWMFRDLVHS